MKSKCVFSDTVADNVICCLYNRVLGDIMGYDGYFCSKCKSKKEQGTAYTTDEVLRMARMKCAKVDSCANCKLHDICKEYDVTPVEIERFIISLKKNF